MDEDRANLRRWMTSAAIVVGLHGGLVLALVRWHKTISTQPFVMDLAPWAGASGPELGGFQPSLAGLERSGASAQAETATKPSEQKLATAGSAGPGPAEPPQAPQARTSSGDGALKVQPGHGSETANAPASNGSLTNKVPANDHPVNNPVPKNPASNVPAASNAAVNSPPPINPLNNAPIDTRITVQPPLHGRTGPRGIGASDEKGPQGGIGQKGQVIFRPSNRLGELEHPRNFTLPGATAPGLARTRTPGAHVQDRVRAAMARQINAIGNAATALGIRSGPHAGNNVAINAIGIAGPGVGGKGGGANGAGNVTINAIGLTVQAPRGAVAAKGIDGHGANSSVPAMNFGQRSANSIALVGPALSGTSALNGRTMVRPGAATGVIGGPAGRAAGGVLSGSDFHPKIP